MLIPLGFLAASGVSAGSFDLLETQVLGSSTSSVTFSSLSTYASTYQHLQLRYTARSDRANTLDAMIIQVNGDTGTNYKTHQLVGNGSSASSGAESYANGWEFMYVPGNNASSGVFGAGVVDILDPFETTKNKTKRSLSGVLSDTYIQLSSGVWLNTAAITSITFDQRYGSNFVSGSRFSLYGIKAA